MEKLGDQVQDLLTEPTERQSTVLASPTDWKTKLLFPSHTTTLLHHRSPTVVELRLLVLLKYSLKLSGSILRLIIVY
jgi:hypothetical protein